MLEYVAILAFATALIELVETCLKLYLSFRETRKTDKELSGEQK